MRLLLDTQVLVWMVTGDCRFEPNWLEAFQTPGTELRVSAVIAAEYTELLVRKRLPIDEPMDELIERFALTLVDFPADVWRLLPELPGFHRDPVDRMLVAHALLDNSSLVTADANIRRYPVMCI